MNFFLNFRLKWLAEWGLVDYWVKRTTPRNDECKAFSKASDDRKILSLNDLSGPFIFLITGSILSLFVFLLEKLYYHFNQGIDLKSSPIETTEIDHSLKDTDYRIVVMDEPFVDIENQESCFDATIKDKVENVATTSATDLKVEEEEFETETVEQDGEPKVTIDTHLI